MFKALMRKQLSELKSVYLPSKKKNGEKRSTRSLVWLGILFFFLYLFVAFAFFGMGMLLCDAFHAVDMDWFYFTFVSLLSVFMGIVGSVFSAYSLLFRAKDNEFLLSLPIRPSMLLTTRILCVYAMGLLFEGLVYLPMLLVFLINADVTAGMAVIWVVNFFLLGGIISALTCLFGWVIAVINSRSKHKSITSVLLSVVLIGVYYVCYFRLNGMLTNLAQNALTIGTGVQGKARFLYELGRAYTGSLLPELGFAAVALAAQGLTVYILSKTFLRIVTRPDTTVRREYKGGRQSSRSPLSALIRKEFKRFVSSPAYLLNGGLGLLIMPALAVFAAVKAGTVLEFLDAMRSEIPAEILRLINYVPCIAFSLIVPMDAISSPSISLEGKTMWILRSLPVNVKQVYVAKQVPHVVLNGIVSLVSTLVVCIALRLGAVYVLMNLLFIVLITLLSAAVGLLIGILKPIFDWPNEQVPVKSGVATTVSIFGGWFVGLACGAALYFTRSFPFDFFPVLLVILAVGTLLAEKWIFTKGTVRFESM